MKSSERFGIIRRAATVILVFVVMTAVMAGCKISNTSLKSKQLVFTGRLGHCICCKFCFNQLDS